MPALPKMSMPKRPAHVLVRAVSKPQPKLYESPVDLLLNLYESPSHLASEIFKNEN